MAGKQSSGGRQGEPVRSEITDGGVEPAPEELEENPMTTVYRNVRDMSRREFLAAAALTGGGYAAWISDVDGDGASNGRELAQGTNPVAAGGPGGDGVAGGESTTTPSYSSLERQALQHAEERYPDHVDRVEAFIDDDQVAQDFVDEQLQLWLSAPREWQEGILAHNALYLNDWNRNGQPHLLPDGSRGSDYGHPFEPGSEDALMEAYYNISAMTHDVRTGEYVGFRPADGDRVGKLGDREGNGSVAAYLDGVEGEELIGRQTWIVEVDYMPGQKPLRESLDLVEEVYADFGVTAYFYRSDEVHGEDWTDGDDAHRLHEEYQEDALMGAVDYCVFVNSAGTPANPASGFRSGYSSFVVEGYDHRKERDDDLALDRVTWEAGLILHEAGHLHGLGHPEGSPDTAMLNPAALQYTQAEEEQIRENLGETVYYADLSA